jgi:hypothetical protein
MTSEDQIQQQIVNFFTNNYCLKHHSPRCSIFSVPNGGSRHILEAKKLKATGMKAGVSDLIVLMPNRAIFIELKNEKGIQSESQKEFEQSVSALGFEYYLIRSLDQFIEVIKKTAPKLEAV